MAAIQWERRYLMPAGFGALFLMGLITGVCSQGQPDKRTDIDSTHVPKEVLAFYYGWYGNPEVSKRWVHWKNVDAAHKHIDESTHFPALGAYDSHDPEVVETHCRQAHEAGLTGFIVSWWRRGDFHDQGLPSMLDKAQKWGLKISIYYETAPSPSAPSTEDVVQDLLYIVRTYTNHPAWLKVNGKPVFFVYGRAIAQLKLEGWQKVLSDFRVKHPEGAVFIGDRISSEAARVFDGIHTYNPTGLTKGKSPAEVATWARTTYPQWVKTAGPTRISCLTIIPGYDDSAQPSRKPPRPITERYGGKTYAALWKAAIEANPDWILITSWNEWHEGSEIEPSAELGDNYLTLTRQFARKLVRAAPRT